MKLIYDTHNKWLTLVVDVESVIFVCTEDFVRGKSTESYRLSPVISH
jgi:hypothetical protein